MIFESMRQKSIPPTPSRSSTNTRSPSIQPQRKPRPSAGTSSPQDVHVLPLCCAGKTIDGCSRVLALDAGHQEPVLSPLERDGREGALRDGIDERAGRAPRFLVFPVWIQVSKLRLILFFVQIIDQVVATVANEDLVLLDDLDERLHPARRRFNRQAGGGTRQNHPDLTLLHSVKQSGKCLSALSEPRVIGEIPHFAIVRCRINRCLAVVVHLL